MMDLGLVISLIMLGIAMGAGTDWLFWRRKFVQAGEEANARGEALRQDYEKRLAVREEQLGDQGRDLDGKKARLSSLEEELSGLRRESSELGERLREEGRKRTAAEAVSARIPGLEENLAAAQAELAQLREEKAGLETRVASLEETLAEERKSLQECLIFVEGSHYLPGKVVRNLTRGEKQP